MNDLFPEHPNDGVSSGRREVRTDERPVVRAGHEHGEGMGL